MLLGGIECGSTNMVCAVGDEYGNISDKILIPTRTPEETLPSIIEYFKKYNIVAAGIACFGPIDLNRRSETFGYITSTTKKEWADYNILGRVAGELKVPCGFDTDVNGAVLGETAYGCMRGMSNGIYMRVAGGIGVGVLSNGKLLHGMLHPEAGHIFVRQHPEDSFEGLCSYHRNCLEGLASVPALVARAGKQLEEITEDDKVWDIFCYYIAQAISNFILTLSPERIVLGGEAFTPKHVIVKIRGLVKEFLGGYISTDQLEDIDKYIVKASINEDMTILGCFKLAYDAAIKS